MDFQTAGKGLIHIACNRLFNFSLDTGLITVRGTLDYELTSMYNLTVQATETTTGLTSTAIVIIEIQVS